MARTPLGDKGTYANNIIGCDANKNAGTITTKAGSRGSDNYIANITQEEVDKRIYLKGNDTRNMKETLCDNLLFDNKVKENDCIRLDHTSSRSEKFYTNNSIDNNTSPTLDTRCDCFGVVVGGVIIPEATKKGYAIAHEGDGVDIGARSVYHRGNVQREMQHTLKTQCDCGVVGSDLRIRKLTPKECFRLMGVKDEQSDKLTCSNAQKYKQAGNSIVTTVLMGIFGELYGIDYTTKIKEWNYETKQIEENTNGRTNQVENRGNISAMQY